MNVESLSSYSPSSYFVIAVRIHDSDSWWWRGREWWITLKRSNRTRAVCAISLRSTFGRLGNVMYVMARREHSSTRLWVILVWDKQWLWQLQVRKAMLDTSIIDRAMLSAHPLKCTCSDLSEILKICRFTGWSCACGIIGVFFFWCRCAER